MTIALICPTRGRPEQCKRMIKSVKNTAWDPNNIYIYLAYSVDDSEIYDMNSYNTSCQERLYIYADGIPTAHKWNLLAERAMENPDTKLFMLAADDMVFTTPCWDKALLEHYNSLEKKIHVYHLRDSRDENGTPHIIVTREYIEAMGYFVPPIFLHWFIDSWTVEIAKANGVFTHLKDYLLVHDKPSDKGRGDETHNRIRSMGWRERDGWVADKMKPWLEYEKKRLQSKL